MGKVHNLVAARAQGQAILDDGDELETMQARVLALQQTLMERDNLIHDLNHGMMLRQREDSTKQELKRRFNVIEAKHVDTTTTETSLADAMNLMLYTLKEHFGGTVGVQLLDTPYNKDLGATNTSYRTPKLLKAFWSAPTRSVGAELMSLMEDVTLFRDIALQKTGKVFDEWETQAVCENIAWSEGVEALMVVPVVVDGNSIAMLVFLNGQYDLDAPRGTLGEVLPELWTSNISPLINKALENQRKSRMESALVRESLLRDEIILSLDTLLDGVVEQSIQEGARGDVLWQSILRCVANYFEKYFSGDVLLAITNTPANFKITRSCSESDIAAEDSTGTGSGGCGSEPLEFVHYVFSSSLDVVRSAGKMRSFTHPKLGKSKLFQQILTGGKPYHSACPGDIPLPCNHMKISSLLVVPIIFCDQPVGMIGISNGDFDASIGRVLQSVFATFWSMVVKATLFSQSQKVLDSAMPQEISSRLKKNEVIADSYENATVCFLDIVGFGRFIKDLDCEVMVKYANSVFARIDALLVQHSLEKIKLIGDCCMIAGGLKDKRADALRPQVTFNAAVEAQLREVCDFAIAMQREAALITAHPEDYDLPLPVREKLQQTPLQFRIGVACGPITAGVFGMEKVQYDILGATVNLAARLKSNAQPGHIHCSERVQAMVRSQYQFTEQPPLTLKGFGLQQTYVLDEQQGLSLTEVRIDLASPPKPTDAKTIPPPALRRPLPAQGQRERLGSASTPLASPQRRGVPATPVADDASPLAAANVSALFAKKRELAPIRT